MCWGRSKINNEINIRNAVIFHTLFFLISRTFQIFYNFSACVEICYECGREWDGGMICSAPPTPRISPFFGMWSGCYKTFGLVIVARSLYLSFPLARTTPFSGAIQFYWLSDSATISKFSFVDSKHTYRNKECALLLLSWFCMQYVRHLNAYCVHIQPVVNKCMQKLCVQKSC